MPVSLRNHVPTPAFLRYDHPAPSQILYLPCQEKPDETQTSDRSFRCLILLHEEAVVRFTVIPRDNTNIPISTSSKTLSEAKDNNHKQQKQQSVDKDNLPGKESK